MRIFELLKHSTGLDYMMRQPTGETRAEFTVENKNE